MSSSVFVNFFSIVTSFFLSFSLSASVVLDSIIERAEEFNRPIVLFCLKEPPCPWSKILQERILSSHRFHKLLQQEAWIQSIYQENQSEERVRFAKPLQTLPCVVLLDPHGREFARLDYDQSDADEFSAKILHLFDDFHEICLAIDQGLHRQEESRLKFLYQQSKRLSDPAFTKLILHKGCQIEKGVFFHLEKYASMLQKGKLKHPLVRKWREKILAKDPQNRLFAHREIAWLEFRKKAQELQGKEMAKKAIAPLLVYLKQWGDKERDRWKIEALLAKFLFARESNSLAQEFAKKAYIDAPDEKRKEISAVFSRMGVPL